MPYKNKNPFGPPLGRLSLYIHVPFCERKCPYCSFESSVPSTGDAEIWLNALAGEFAWWRDRIGMVELNTCYIGGGTPTVLTPHQWDSLIGIIAENFKFNDDAEVTVEANPNSLRAEHLAIWRDWRVTRTSIGVQSFDDAELNLLGRLHDSRQAHDALSAALASGFSVNADLMFGLPHQTSENWWRTLHDAVRTGVHHLSLYQLSLEAGSLWENMPSATLTDGYLPYRMAQWYLPAKGFKQYEVSNFAKLGRESLHNINYWRGGDYLGAGPGASGYIGGWRYKNISGLKKYSEAILSGRSAIGSGERLDDGAAAREASVLALRMNEGIDTELYVERYGAAALNNVVTTLGGFPRDLYSINSERICLTKKGMRLANILWRELI